VNVAQQITLDIGVFARVGWADGRVEAYEFTDIDRTASAGLSMNGRRWGRPADTFGVGAVVSGISNAHEAYLAAGGLGILVGDGQLPHPGQESIVESYYRLPLRPWQGDGRLSTYRESRVQSRPRTRLSPLGARTRAILARLRLRPPSMSRRGSAPLALHCLPALRAGGDVMNGWTKT
jgi:high affinity Mn2+ porin